MSVYEELKVLSTQPTMIDMNNAMYIDPMAQPGHSTTQNGGPWYDYNSFNHILVRPITPVPAQQITTMYAPPQMDEVAHIEASMQPLQSLPAKARNNPKIKQKQLAVRIYYCMHCDATFASSSNLKSHTRIHTGERPYKCDLCDASFVQSSNLKVHKRTHTGERPYVCKECGQAFSRTSHLTGHKRTHTGERPYLCGICNEAFVTSTHLRNHMRKHTGEKPYVCHICPAAFPQNTSLQTHLRIHTGERPFKCSDCPSAFRAKGDLCNHRKLHLEDRLHSCSKCPKTFKTYQYLRKHFKKCGAPPSGKKRGRPRVANDEKSVKHSSHGCGKNGKKITRTKSRPTRSRRSAKIDKEFEMEEEELFSEAETLSTNGLLNVDEPIHGTVLHLNDNIVPTNQNLGHGNVVTTNHNAEHGTIVTTNHNTGHATVLTTSTEHGTVMTTNHNTGHGNIVTTHHNGVHENVVKNGQSYIHSQILHAPITLSTATINAHTHYGQPIHPSLDTNTLMPVSHINASQSIHLSSLQHIELQVADQAITLSI